MDALEGARVMAAMSGGVDSSVAALLLREAGVEVAGVTLRMFGNEVLSLGADSSCCSLGDVEDARQVAFSLGLEHFTFNFTEVFGREVMDRFCASYLCGRTPNPCIDCNRYVKFRALQERRRQLGFDFVATGHYARRRFDEKDGRWKLLRGVDAAKDQSYVLYHLSQDDLAHMLFPVGGLTKPEVRALAAERGLVNAKKPESEDICFVPDGDYAAFIRRYCGQRAAEGDVAWAQTCRHGGVEAAFEPGPIVDADGRVLGEHQGLVRYTIGQRRGLGVAVGEPLYVLAKDVDKNELVVGPREALLVREVCAEDLNLIGVERLDEPLRVTAKTRYRHHDQPGWAVVEDGLLRMRFDEPLVRPASGQSLVLYEGDVVVGGGTVVSAV